MKSKGSASLYEVLKSASRPSDGAGAAASEATPPPVSAEAGGQPTLQERLAAYKAAKLAEATQPSPLVPVVTAMAPETPLPASAAVPPEQKPAAVGPKGPGERVLRMTYNTAVFAGLVVLGLAFVAYAIGVQTGRKRALEAAASEAPAPAKPFVNRDPAPLPPRPQPPPPPPAPKEYTIRLAEWKYGTAQERLKADAAADDCKRALDRANFKGSKKELIRRGDEPRLALYVDAFADPAAPAVKSRFAAIQKLKVGTQYPFALAQVEESPK